MDPNLLNNPILNEVLNRIRQLQVKEKFKERKEVYNIDEQLKIELFDNLNVKINIISPSIEHANTNFCNHYNKMILLAIIFSLNEDFRNINFENQANLIDTIYNTNIKNYITTRNEKNKFFYKIHKNSLNSYYESNNYSNAIIDLYACILNINIFIIDYNNGKYYVGLYSTTDIFNSNKPSIIIWHPNKLMYYPLSYDDKFIFYKENNDDNDKEKNKNIFNKFLKHKVFYMQSNCIENNIFIKDINVKYEKMINEDYDGDLDLIYNYKITLPKKIKNKKNKDSTDTSNSLYSDNKQDLQIIKNNNDNNDNKENDKENKENNEKKDKKEEKNKIEEIENTETNINKVMVITDIGKIYTEEELNKFKISDLKILFNENQVSFKGLKLKKQFVDAYLKYQNENKK